MTAKVEKTVMLHGDVLVYLITKEFSQKHLVFEKKYRFPSSIPNILKYHLLAWDTGTFLFHKSCPHSLGGSHLIFLEPSFEEHCTVNFEILKITPRPPSELTLQIW